jgi:hypothetical protein
MGSTPYSATNPTKTFVRPSTIYVYDKSGDPRFVGYLIVIQVYSPGQRIQAERTTCEARVVAPHDNSSSLSG